MDGIPPIVDPMQFNAPMELYDSIWVGTLKLVTCNSPPPPQNPISKVLTFLAQNPLLIRGTPASTPSTLTFWRSPRQVRTISNIISNPRFKLVKIRCFWKIVTFVLIVMSWESRNRYWYWIMMMTEYRMTMNEECAKWNHDRKTPIKHKVIIIIIVNEVVYPSHVHRVALQSVYPHHVHQVA